MSYIYKHDHALGSDIPSLQAGQAVSLQQHLYSLHSQTPSLWKTRVCGGCSDVSLGVPVAGPGTHRQNSLVLHLTLGLSYPRLEDLVKLSGGFEVRALDILWAPPGLPISDLLPAAAGAQVSEEMGEVPSSPDSQDSIWQ